MAGPFDAELIRTLVQRELQKEQTPFLRSEPAPASMPVRAMSPRLLSLIGAAADISGTYAGLRTGKGSEDNALLTGKSPARVALGLGAQYAGQRGLVALLKELKLRGVADAIDANAGAEQLGLGADWMRILMGDRSPQSGWDAVADAKNRALAESMRRQK